MAPDRPRPRAGRRALVRHRVHRRHRLRRQHPRPAGRGRRRHRRRRLLLQRARLPERPDRRGRRGRGRRRCRLLLRHRQRDRAPRRASPCPPTRPRRSGPPPARPASSACATTSTPAPASTPRSGCRCPPTRSAPHVAQVERAVDGRRHQPRPPLPRRRRGVRQLHRGQPRRLRAALRVPQCGRRRRPRNVDVVVQRPTGSTTPRFKLEHVRSQLTASEYSVGTLGDVMGPNAVGHATAPGGVGVAAVPYNNARLPSPTPTTGPPPGTTARSSAPRRPRRSPAPLVIAKPDVAATDGGRTTFFYDQTAPFTTPALLRDVGGRAARGGGGRAPARLQPVADARRRSPPSSSRPPRPCPGARRPTSAPAWSTRRPRAHRSACPARLRRASP